MKTLSIIFLLALFTLGLGQFKTDTMQVDITIPAPQTVLAQINELSYFFEFQSTQGAIQLHEGMTYDEVMALGAIQVVPPSPLTYNTELPIPANGSYYRVGVWALDRDKNEFVGYSGLDEYTIVAGFSPIGKVPLVQDTIKHVVHPVVNVKFKGQ